MHDTYLYLKCLCITLMLSIKQQLLNHSMQHSPFCKANRSPAAQGVPCILQNQKVHYHIHMFPPILCILTKLDPVHVPTNHLLKFHLNIILLSTSVSPKLSLTFRYPQQNTVYTFPVPICATCPAYLILPYFITRKILVERSKSLSSSLCCNKAAHLSSNCYKPQH